MDRDPSANVVDNQDRTTPTDGRSPFGESGDERARAAAERDTWRDSADDAPADDEGREAEHKDERSSGLDAGFPATPLPPD
jgi:hypothetical protein